MPHDFWVRAGGGFGWRGFFEGLVLLLAGVGAVYGEKHEVVFGEDVESAGGVAGRDKEGVLTDAGDRGGVAAGLLDLGAGGLESGARLEGNIDAVLASGVAPGAVVGVLGDAGLAGVDGRVEDGLDLVRGEEAAGDCALAPTGMRVTAAAIKRVVRIMLGSAELDV